jgi:hypothetical protein
VLRQHVDVQTYFKGEVQRLGAMLDVDRSGTISKEEFQAGLWQWVKDSRVRHGVSTERGAQTSRQIFEEIRSFFSQFHVSTILGMQQKLTQLAMSGLRDESTFSIVQRLDRTDTHAGGLSSRFEEWKSSVVANFELATKFVQACMSPGDAGAAASARRPSDPRTSHSVHRDDVVASLRQVDNLGQVYEALKIVSWLLLTAEQWRSAPFEPTVHQVLVSTFDCVYRSGIPSALVMLVYPSRGRNPEEAMKLAMIRARSLQCLSALAQGPCLPHMRLDNATDAPWHPQNVWETTRMDLMKVQCPGTSPSDPTLPEVITTLMRTDPANPVRMEAAYCLATLASDPGARCHVGRDSFRRHMVRNLRVVDGALERLGDGVSPEPPQNQAALLSLISVCLGHSYDAPPAGIMAMADCFLFPGDASAGPADARLSILKLAFALREFARAPLTPGPTMESTLSLFEVRLHVCNAIAQLAPLLGGQVATLMAPIVKLAELAPLSSPDAPVRSGGVELIRSALRTLSFLLLTAATPDPRADDAAAVRRHGLVVEPARDASVMLFETDFVERQLLPILQTCLAGDDAASSKLTLLTDTETTKLRAASLQLIESAALAGLASPKCASIHAALVTRREETARVLLHILTHFPDLSPRVARICQLLLCAGRKPPLAFGGPSSDAVAGSLVAAGVVEALLKCIERFFERPDPVLTQMFASTGAAIASDPVSAARSAVATLDMIGGRSMFDSSTAASTTSAAAAINPETVSHDLDLLEQCLWAVSEVLYRAVSRQSAVDVCRSVVLDHLSFSKVRPALMGVLTAVYKQYRLRIPRGWDLGARAVQSVLTVVFGGESAIVPPPKGTVVGVLFEAKATLESAPGAHASAGGAYLKQVSDELQAYGEVLSKWQTTMASLEAERHAGMHAAASSIARPADGMFGGGAAAPVMMELRAIDMGTPGDANYRVFRVSTAWDTGVILRKIQQQFSCPVGQPLSLFVLVASPDGKHTPVLLNSNEVLSRAFELAKTMKFFEVRVHAGPPSAPPLRLPPSPWHNAGLLLAAPEEGVRRALQQDAVEWGAPELDRRQFSKFFARFRERGVATLTKTEFIDMMLDELRSGRGGVADARARLERLFNAMDKDGGGSIDLR